MILKPPSRTPRRRKIVTVDGEWYPGTYEYRVGGIYDGERHRSFTKPEALLAELLTRKNAHATIYWHAGGRFDVAHFLRPLLTNPNYTVKGAFAGSSLIWLIVRDGYGRNWKIVDSYRTFPVPLKLIGESIGIKKLDDYECANYPDCGHKEKCVFYAPLPILTTYNEQDCLILHEALSRLQETLLDMGGELGITAASSAMLLFRRSFLKNPIRTNPTINKLARQAYVGSRVEPFRPEGTIPLNWYDINASFPWSMTQSIPGSYMGPAHQWDPSDDIALVRARVRVPEDSYVPPLPYRTKDERIFHPTGSWEGWFMGVDLQGLLQSGGRIERVSRVHRFEKRNDTAEYAQTLFDMRSATTDKFLSFTYKLLNNSLYGKFVQSPDMQGFVRLSARADVPESAEALFGAPNCYMVPTHRRQAHEHVPLGAVITARSRQYLGALLRNRAHHVWYCDTDSVVTDRTIDAKLGLGQVKHEHVSSYAAFAAPKTYYRQCSDSCLCGKPQSVIAKMKGISAASRQSYDAFTSGEPVKQSRQASPKEMLRTGNLHPYEVEIEKIMRGRSRPKRAPDGNDTRPWTVKELR